MPSIPMGTAEETPIRQARSSRFYQAGRSRDGKCDVSGVQHNGDMDKDINPPHRRDPKDTASGNSTENGGKGKGSRSRDLAPISSVGSGSSASSQPSSSPKQERSTLVDGKAVGNSGSGRTDPVAASAEDVTAKHDHVGQNSEKCANTERGDSTTATSAPAAAAAAAAVGAVSSSSVPAKIQPSPAEPDRTIHSAGRSTGPNGNTSDNAARGSGKHSDHREVGRPPQPRTHQATGRKSDRGSRNKKSADGIFSTKKVAGNTMERPQQKRQQRQHKSHPNKSGHQKNEQQQHQPRPQ